MSSQHPENSESNIGSLVSGTTSAVKNIEAAYSRAGASSNGTHAAGTKPGSQEQEGIGSAKLKEPASDQRQEPSVVGKVLNNFMNGVDSTK